MMAQPIPAAVEFDSTNGNGGWYHAPGWRAAAAYRPLLTHTAWVSIKSGWYDTGFREQREPADASQGALL
jgi:hypothetical protein